MNFSDKIKNKSKDSKLSFLIQHGFTPNETCGYGCCKGYFNGYHSSNRLDYNRVTIFVDGEAIRTVNHNEYDVGGHNYDMSDCIDYEGATEEDIIEMISYVLPDDLD